MKGLLANFRAGTRSLKTTLALYFIPISVLPTLSISFYAFSLFQESTKESLFRRSMSERDAILSEIDSLERELVQSIKYHADLVRLKAALQERNKAKAEEALAPLRQDVSIRLYLPNGNFLAGRVREGERANYLPREGLKRVQSQGLTSERYPAPDGNGFIVLSRVLVKDSRQMYGILEEEFLFGPRQFSDLKSRRQTDVLLLKRDFSTIGGSFALSHDSLNAFALGAFKQISLDAKTPLFVELADNRYAAFLYDMSGQGGRNKKWGYVGVFLPMTSVDATLGKLQVAIIYLTLLLILTAMLAIFVFSNRIVKPIVVLVAAMKRVKTGPVEQLPHLDSTYEIEYLVRSFNDMTRNVSAAKRTLELKLDELNRANSEIRDTQSTLVQSAKMISLGQIVAGVAHELNNPIGFIYSNMHHLSEYVAKMRVLVENFRSAYPSLPEAERKRLMELETKLEVDYILKDMEDLTQSCVEGARRTKEIVLGLRTFSRVDEAEMRLVDLHEGIRSTVRLLASEFRDRVKVHMEFGDIGDVECNLSQMNQVFMNLLGNAGQAISGTGEIWIRTRRDEDGVVIEIEDSGSGIPEDVIEKVFDPFFTTKKVGQGTGLGLSIAYSIIQKHHGVIAVQSKAGIGTRFTIKIPLRQPNAISA